VFEGQGALGEVMDAREDLEIGRRFTRYRGWLENQGIRGVKERSQLIYVSLTTW
jgi:hypothetical protein